MDTERESNTSGYSATEALYVALRGVDTEHIAEVIVERDPQGEPGPSLIRAVLREIPAADCATQRHLEIGREEFQNRDLAPVGPQSRQARPRGPTLFSTMSVPWPSCYIARLLPIQKAISRSDQDGVLLGEDQSTTRASCERNLVSLALVFASHGSENPSEVSLVGEDHLTDPNVFDVLDSVSGDDLLSGEQATEDRLDPVPLAGLVEVDRAEQLAVVGHGQRRHPHAGPGGRRPSHQSTPPHCRPRSCAPTAASPLRPPPPNSSAPPARASTTPHSRR